MELIELKCKNCGAILKVDSTADKFVCQYCQTEILIDDEATKIKRVERAKNTAKKEKHQQELQQRQENTEQAIKEREALNQQRLREEKERNEAKNKESFKTLIIILFVFAILAFFIFPAQKILIIIQIIFCVVFLLIDKQVIKPSIKIMDYIVGILAFVMIIPIFHDGISHMKHQDYKEITWDYIILKDELPSLDGLKGKIYDNNDNEMYIYVECDSEDFYRIYIELCKKYGYTIDMKNGNHSYEAKNGEYQLKMNYYESSEYCTIDLEKISDQN